MSLGFAWTSTVGRSSFGKMNCLCMMICMLETLFSRTCQVNKATSYNKGGPVQASAYSQRYQPRSSSFVMDLQCTCTARTRQVNTSNLYNQGGPAQVSANSPRVLLRACKACSPPLRRSIPTGLVTGGPRLCSTSSAEGEARPATCDQRK